METNSSQLLSNMSEEERELYSREALKLGSQLCFPLYACARKVTGLYTPYLKPLGLTYTQYLVFMVLWEQDDISVGELGRRLFLDSGTLTPLLKKMEEKALIVRGRCPDDERCVKVTLTDEGRHMRDKVLDIPARVGSCIRLSSEEAGIFHHLLYKVIGTIEEQSQEQVRNI